MFGAGWCGGLSAWGWVFMAVAWGGFLAVVVWAVTWLFPRGPSWPSGHRDAVQQDAAGLLNRRFASGEIDEDTYRRMRGELTATHRPGTATQVAHPRPSTRPCPLGGEGSIS